MFPVLTFPGIAFVLIGPRWIAPPGVFTLGDQSTKFLRYTETTQIDLYSLLVGWLAGPERCGACLQAISVDNLNETPMGYFVPPKACVDR